MVRVNPIVRLAVRALAAGLLAGIATGCAVIHDLATDPKEKPPSLVGKHASALEDVTAIHLHRGRLMVALTDGFERPYSLAGIAIVDTSTDLVIAHVNPFGDQWQIPWSVASFRDSLLFAVNYDGRVRVADSSGVWHDVQVPYPVGYPERLVTVSGDRVLLMDQIEGNLFTVSGQTASLSFQAGYGQPLMGAAIAGNRLYALRYNSRKLFVVEGTALDSLDLTNLSGKPGLKCRPELVIARGNRVFIPMSVADSLGVRDTGLVAVLDGATLAVDTILKLKYPYLNGYSGEIVIPRIVDGKLYLTGRFPSFQEKSGVEVIDLDNASILGEVLTHQDAGGRIHDFVPAGPGKAYILQSPVTGASWTIRRASPVVL
jgi:hypothetical protein